MRCLAGWESVDPAPTWANFCSQQRGQQASRNWEQRKADYRRAVEMKMEASRERMIEVRREFREASARLRAALRAWRAAQRRAQAQFGLAPDSQPLTRR